MSACFLCHTLQMRPLMGILLGSKPLLGWLQPAYEVGKQSGPPRIQSSSGPCTGLTVRQAAESQICSAEATPSPASSGAPSEPKSSYPINTHSVKMLLDDSVAVASYPGG